MYSYRLIKKKRKRSITITKIIHRVLFHHFSIIHSIGIHNIRCTKQKLIVGKSRTSCNNIFPMHNARNLKHTFFLLICLSLLYT